MSIVIPIVLVTPPNIPDNNALSKVDTGPPNEHKNALAVLINSHCTPLINAEFQSTPSSLIACVTASAAMPQINPEPKATPLPITKVPQHYKLLRQP